MGTDILKVVEAQPALLLQEGSPLDDAEVRCVLPSSPQPGVLSLPSDPLAAGQHEPSFMRAIWTGQAWLKTGNARVELGVGVRVGCLTCSHPYYCVACQSRKGKDAAALNMKACKPSYSGKPATVADC